MQSKNKMAKLKYNLIYSLGTDCACAMYMFQNKLRTFSGPFDWLTHALFATRVQLILNDFQDFLNISDLRFLEKDPNIINDNTNDYYENIKNGFYFYHDFPAGVSIDVSWPKVRDKYQRRINRFYEKIISSDNVLLIWFAHNQVTSDELVLSSCQSIRSKFNKDIDFLIIEHDETKKIGEIKKREISKGITKYSLYTMKYDEKGNPTPQGDMENCNKIFKQYQLIIPFWKKLLRIFIRIICLFTPKRSWRKKLRRI